jgi:hypothetical protein
MLTMDSLPDIRQKAEAIEDRISNEYSHLYFELNSRLKLPRGVGLTVLDHRVPGSNVETVVFIHWPPESTAKVTLDEVLVLKFSLERFYKSVEDELNLSKPMIDEVANDSRVSDDAILRYNLDRDTNELRVYMSMKDFLFAQVHAKIAELGQELLEA